ncbi:hypothetical protein AAFF_G00141300 [Aldrovandia affinis]|uniref:Uncharacterized protein n=1 Tax=Aldrovandia affinis TaxID=143900 RepID=A0AAD7X279_9TELE|nr:hypothetical protein AAFF_G00141300 [Aldrovandia affinis]
MVLCFLQLSVRKQEVWRLGPVASGVDFLPTGHQGALTPPHHYHHLQRCPIAICLSMFQQIDIFISGSDCPTPRLIPRKQRIVGLFALSPRIKACRSCVTRAIWAPRPMRAEPVIRLCVFSREAARTEGRHTPAGLTRSDSGHEVWESPGLKVAVAGAVLALFRWRGEERRGPGGAGVKPAPRERALRRGERGWPASCL